MENGGGGKDLFFFVAEWSEYNFTQVLERSSGESEICGAIYAICLLEGPWVVALSSRGTDNHLLVFNTLLPPQDARSWRLLQLPQLIGSRRYSSAVQYGDLLAECPEFSVDPAQRNFVVSSLQSALVIPVEPLIRLMCSARVGSNLKWDEWAEYVIKTRRHPNTVTLWLVGTKLLALINSDLEGWYVEVYDLSKSGQKDIQIQQVNEGQDGECRKLLSTPKCFARWQLDGSPDSMYFFWNKLVCFYVSLLCVQNQSFHIQPPCTEPGEHFWQRSFYRHLENRLNVDHGDSLSSGTLETGDLAPKKKETSGRFTPPIHTRRPSLANHARSGILPYVKSAFLPPVVGVANHDPQTFTQHRRFVAAYYCSKAQIAGSIQKQPCDAE